MFHSLINYSCLAVVGLSLVAAQDSGEGFVFKCDQPGNFALTFDDGPSPYTGTLLATLKSLGVKATFFSVGTQAADASISKYLKQAYEEGHQIASHTNTHADLNKLTADQIKSEITLAENAIRSATGVVPAMIRPPYGNCNEQCRGIMKALGYTVVQWSVDSNDWQYMGQPDNWDKLVSNVANVVSASNVQTDSFISLQHDIHQFSVERTPKVIESIKAKGYNFVTVSQCLSNRFPMYQNKANPSLSTSVSVTTSVSVSVSGSSSASVINSTSTLTPTSNATSISTSGATSSTSSVSTASSSISSTSGTSISSQGTILPSANPTATTQPTSGNNSNSVGSLTPSLTMTLIVLCLGYITKDQ